MTGENKNIKDFNIIFDFLTENSGEGLESDCSIEQIHDFVLILIHRKRYKTIDLLLSIINSKKIDLDILISILTATSWCKEHLKERKKFFNRARWRIDCMYYKGILEGLE